MLMPRGQQRRAKGTGSDSDDDMQIGRGGGRGRGRPMKPFDQLKPSRRVQTLQANLIHKQLTDEIETPKKISALESLPVEIIEQIFFHCLEVNLPRASIHLARALSRPSVYSALVLFAYFDADSSAHVETRHFLPATFRLIELDDKLRLQEDILSSRWCTLEFLHSCIPALTRLTMVRHWHREREQLTATTSPRARQVILDAYFGLPNSDLLLPAIDDTSGVEEYFKLRPAMLPNKQHDESTTPDAPNAHPRLIFETTYLSPIPDQPEEQPIAISLYHAEQSVMLAYTIPENIVLRKPWTDANIKLLQLLRQAMRFGSFSRVPSPQAMFDGMANAVREGNDLALLVLLELYETAVKARHPDQPLPLRLLHMACTEPQLPMRLQCRMISLLLRGAAENVPADDETLTRWAIRATHSSATDHDLSVASQVLKHMESQGGPPNDRSGRAFGAQEGARSSLPSFTEEIGYLDHTSKEV